MSVMVDVSQSILDHVRDVIVGELVHDLASTPFPEDEISLSKGAQMLRDQRLGKLSGLSQCPHGSRSVGEQTHDEES